MSADRGGAYKPTPEQSADLIAAQRNVEQETGKPKMPPKPTMKVTRQQLKDARIPVHLRDYCAHMLLPLDKCRDENYYLPWKCVEERHAYEECQHHMYEYRRRVLQEKGAA